MWKQFGKKTVTQNKKKSRESEAFVTGRLCEKGNGCNRGR